MVDGVASAARVVAMMRRLRRLGVVLGAVLAVIALVRLVEHFGRAGDTEGELATLGGERSGEVFDPAMVWVPVLDLASAPRVMRVGPGAGEGQILADGVVLGSNGEVVVGHRGAGGRVVGAVYSGAGASVVGGSVDAGEALDGAFQGWRTAEIVGEGLEFAGDLEVFLRNHGEDPSPTLLKRPLPAVEDGGRTGLNIMPGI